MSRTMKRETTITGLFTEVKLGNVDFDHPLQRKADQHKDDVKSNFIVTCIANEDFDAIKMCEQIINGIRKVWCIDGKQRFFEMFNFKYNNYKLNKNLSKPMITYLENGEEKVFDLRGKRYSDLPEVLQNQFDTCQVSLVTHLDCTDEEVAYHIQRYNSCQAMSTSEQAILYMSNIAKHIKELSKHELIVDLSNFSEKEILRGAVDRAIAEIIMFVYFPEKWNRNSKKMGNIINNNTTTEMIDELTEYFNRLSCVIDKNHGGKLLTSKNYLVFMALFHKFNELDLEDEKFGEFLDALSNNLANYEFNGESWAQIDASRSTKDKGILTKKVDFLYELMIDFLHCEPSAETVEEFISDVVEEDIDDVTENIGLYKDILDGFNESIIRHGSELSTKKHKKSLLAMVAYSFKHDVDLDDWLATFSNKNETYFSSERENYKYMVRDFEKTMGVA